MIFTDFVGAEVRANGWPKEPTATAQDAWIKQFLIMAVSTSRSRRRDASH
jgi:hypothetical protein